MACSKSNLLKFAPNEPQPPALVEDIGDLVNASDSFNELNPFPLESILVKNLRHRGDDLLLKNANEAYPLVHESVLNLILDFLNLKQQSGSRIEKELYKDMTVQEFIDRLLIKRPLLFVGERDRYILRDAMASQDGVTVSYRTKDGKTVQRKVAKTSGSGGFESIGKKNEQPPLLLRDYISYDEMKISALLATCSPTCAINSGGRRNVGRIDAEDTFVNHAYICGLVGTRLVKLNAMEAQDMRVHHEQNHKSGGPFIGKAESENSSSLAQIFSKFYNIPYFPLYDEVKQLVDPNISERVASIMKSTKLKKDHYISVDAINRRRGNKKLAKTEYFNKHVYQKRIRITAETYLAEANHRAKLAGKKAYVHVVGLGLGVWKMLDVQEPWYVDVFGEVAKKYKFKHISDIDFSWIRVESCAGVKDGQVIDGTSIAVHFSKRDFFDPLDCPDAENKIVVVSWAYDGNSYPGNEFWAGSLHTSGDPQAACSTQVAELHNPLINPRFRGANLHVMKADNAEIVTFQDYWNEVTKKRH